MKNNMNFLKLTKRCMRSLNFKQIRQNGKNRCCNHSIYCNLRYCLQKSAARTLFTVETLDLTTYQNNRRDAFQNVVEANRFKWELQAYVENETELDTVRLKTALEVMAHLATPEDFNLIKKTLYAFDSNASVTGKAKRSIGNLVMAAIYSNNQADVAIEVNFNN